MPKHIRRIAMEPEFFYHEIHGDTFEEVEQAAQKVEEYLRQHGRLHEKKPVRNDSVASEDPLKNANNMNPRCEKCGEPMEYKEGKSKKSGKFWRAYMCPKSSQDDNHPPRWLR